MDNKKQKTMHDVYGEPDDEVGKHKCCPVCGYCIDCNDCKRHGCGVNEVMK